MQHSVLFYNQIPYQAPQPRVRLQIIPEVCPLDGLWLTLLDKMSVVTVFVIFLGKYESLEAQEVWWTIAMWKNIFTRCLILIYDVKSEDNL